MQVQVRLFATFRTGRFSRKTMDLAEGTTLAAVINEVGIPLDEVHLPLVNGTYQYSLDVVLKDGDVVSAFPKVGGG